MARVKGRDVVLDLMDGFQELRSEVDRHREQLVAMEATQAELVSGFRDLATATRATATQLRGLSTHLNLVTVRLNEVTERVDGLEGRMDGLTDRVDSLTVVAERLQQQFGESRRSAERQSDILGDLGDLLGKIVRGTRDRIEDHEERLLALEKKKAS